MLSKAVCKGGLSANVALDLKTKHCKRKLEFNEHRYT